MADEQLEWVFDSLVEFLRGPIWNIPVLTFIEQKSVEQINKQTNNLNLHGVDFMLGSYMEDLRITPEEFEKSCSVASKKALNQFHQVWKAIEEVSEEDSVQPKQNKILPADAALQEKMKLEAQKEKELLEQAIKQSVKEKEEKDVDESEESIPDIEESPPEEPPNEKVRGNIEWCSRRRQPMNRNLKRHLMINLKNLKSQQPVTDAEESEQVLPELPKLSLHGSLPPIELPKSIDVTPNGVRETSELFATAERPYFSNEEARTSQRLSNTEEMITQARPKSARAARKILREESTDVDPQTLSFQENFGCKTEE
ncbi:cilia- and flagella-associated protein 36 [Caerostris extrusa]|uniref:Cilia- and flagella-associated protein 36 n=1 Tax=Caerostris extrusa TaxID=172846 RepID=A0AAV4WHD2_CAEEX|nr:cilia- and flagella-associated protein 36 [Caerostris extrusa]